jgi:Fic family protein
MTVTEAARKWGISDRRVRLLCSQGRVNGVIQEGRQYRIPANAPRPADGRTNRWKDIPAAYAALFRHIDALKQELSLRRPLTQGEVDALRNEFLIEFTYNSNAIEGNTLTLRETAMVLEGMTIDKKPLKDHLEAVGHRDAFVYMEELARKDTPITLHEIRGIHALVLGDRPEDKGRFRRVPVRIVGAYATPTEPYLIEEKLNALLDDDQGHRKNTHPIERIAMLHLIFEGIHPFIDGNGRTGRILMNLELIRQGYPTINVKFTDRKLYYDAFDDYYRDGNADTMVNLIGNYVAERLDEYLRILAD